MKVVIDTNIWISYLIGSLLQNLDNKIVSKEIKIVVSKVMLQELIEVTSRPKFKNIFNKERVKELFSLLDNYAIVISPNKKVEACRDKKDNFLLEAAVEGEADYLITGDEDLLVLNQFHNTKIIKPKQFKEIID